MKKLIVFLFSFIVLLFALQWATGLLLTLLYNPDIEKAWETSTILSNEAAFGGGMGFSTIIIILLAVLLSYLILKVFKVR
ncbi:hypothetical protein ACOJQI_04290 [Bacillus salacetis]|uniref:hypothetical protein n=1 Tax=Bacillus salacetis TaxID=2315464 RepID=UPI003B9E13CC